MEKDKQENGSNNYQMKHSAKFETTFKTLIKNHYRRDIKSREKFIALVENYLEKDLKDNPCSDCVSDPEPFPGNTAEQGFEFRKKRWARLPGLQGAARFGRLLFIVHKSKKIVCPLWIYTHAEFQEPKSRPPDKELAAEINCIKQDILSESESEE